MLGHSRTVALNFLSRVKQACVNLLSSNGRKANLNAAANCGCHSGVGSSDPQAS